MNKFILSGCVASGALFAAATSLAALPALADTAGNSPAVPSAVYDTTHTNDTTQQHKKKRDDAYYAAGSGLGLTATFLGERSRGYHGVNFVGPIKNAPTPEASSVISLGAMIAAGGLGILMLRRKRATH